MKTRPTWKSVQWSTVFGKEVIYAHECACDICKTNVTSLKGNADSGILILEIFASGIRNPGLWNPEYSSRNPESLLRLESGIQIPLTNRPESNIWNPESKTVLEFLISGATNGTCCLRLSNRDIRDLTIRQRRRPWKPHWKISFQTISRLFQVAQLLKRREFMLDLKRGGRTRVQTEMVEFNALPFPSSKTLKIWPRHVVVVRGQQRNAQKKRDAHSELLFF